jgi:Tol biopolymer transport system component
VVLGEQGIYVMDAKDRDGDGNGDNLKRLTEGNWLNVYSPTWSPDGKKIAFTSDREDGDDHQETDIYVMHADGSNPTNLTNRPGEGPDSASEDYADFSPDGTRIVFSRGIRRYYDNGDKESYRRQLYSMKADGTDLVLLANDLALDEPGHVDWGPKPDSIAPANEAKEAQETTAMESTTTTEKTTVMKSLPPNGGLNLLLPAAVLLLGASAFGYAILRGT